MAIVALRRAALLWTVSLITIAGCGSSPQSEPTRVQQPSVEPSQTASTFQKPQVELPFPDTSVFGTVAVDTAGNVYTIDSSDRIVKLPAGSNTPIPLPFTGLKGPQDVAVDSAGNIYVNDFGGNRVIEL